MGSYSLATVKNGPSKSISNQAKQLYVVQSSTSFVVSKLYYSINYYLLVDVFCGQLIKLAQVASTSELFENQRNTLLFFEIVPCQLVYFLTSKKVRGIFMIIEIRLIFSVNKILKIEIFGGHEVLNCILSVQKNQFLEILEHQNIHFSTWNLKIWSKPFILNF